MKRTVSDLGEKKLLKRLSRHLGSGSRVVRTFSEDCAVIDCGGPDYLLYSIDAFVEGVHWRREYASPFYVGRKALTVNVSDIYAMGGRPLYYLISLMIPPQTGVSWIDELYRGLDSVSRETGIKLIGGNVARAEQISLDLVVVGEVPKRKVILRDGARVGDAVFVSGELGAAAAGLQLLSDGHRLNSRSRKVNAVVQAHLNPPVRKTMSGLIAPWATSMIDVSDGFAADLGEICRESGVGAVVHSGKIPVAKSIAGVLDKLHGSPLALALGGGEDYELLFTVSRKNIPEMQKRLAKKKLRVHEVGIIVEESRGVMLVDESGAATRLQGGYQHFYPARPKR